MRSRSRQLPAWPWLAILWALVGCYDVTVIELPGPPPPRKLFPNQPPVPVVDYATLIRLPNGEPALATTRGADSQLVPGCGLDTPGHWFEGAAPTMSAVQFPIDILQGDGGEPVDVSDVCVTAVPSCEGYDQCPGAKNEFVVRRGEPCVKVDPGTYFTFYRMSDAEWTIATGTMTDDIRCRLALQLIN